ncbi:hypothetical protein NDU88_000364 [Pleurodeles waltl]|uniref:Uncharacterized protein n=1 Tax=Pleurodeles waltl TaxID=8319 RepID=A0AAV7S9B4_PLEWA|nr:hypothetical protein NDU88_000364 [Pleurodeles waltl]
MGRRRPSWARVLEARMGEGTGTLSWAAVTGRLRREGSRWLLRAMHFVSGDWASLRSDTRGGWSGSVQASALSSEERSVLCLH